MNQKALYIVGASIVGLTVSYFGFKIYQANEAKKEAELEEQDLADEDSDENDGILGAGQQGSQGQKKSSDSFPLKVGKYGNKIFILQSALNNLGASLTVDGKFGKNTYKAILDNSGQWNFLCNIGFGCVLTKEEYDLILKKAETNGWKEKDAKIIADKSWLPFSIGNSNSYSNIKI